MSESLLVYGVRSHCALMENVKGQACALLRCHHCGGVILHHKAALVFYEIGKEGSRSHTLIVCKQPACVEAVYKGRTALELQDYLLNALSNLGVKTEADWAEWIKAALARRDERTEVPLDAR